MPRSVEEIYGGIRVLREVMVVHPPAITPVHVFYPDCHTQCSSECRDVHVVTLVVHWFDLLWCVCVCVCVCVVSEREREGECVCVCVCVCVVSE